MPTSPTVGLKDALCNRRSGGTGNRPTDRRHRRTNHASGNAVEVSFLDGAREAGAFRAPRRKTQEGGNATTASDALAHGD